MWSYEDLESFLARTSLRPPSEPRLPESQVALLNVHSHSFDRIVIIKPFNPIRQNSEVDGHGATKANALPGHHQSVCVHGLLHHKGESSNFGHYPGGIFKRGLRTQNRTNDVSFKHEILP